ncbi:FecR family protein [Echinicola sp. 20G]|uniref:FecR family protein n=1 Tax=Echinicola sp. 20G TaxID=2781961 RepID=UPI001910CB03|nr:FecR family protein [Echinicola sp. 20G]
MKEGKYNIEYFLSNKYFINWVNNPTEESDAFWQKWLRNHPESQEEFDQAKAVVLRINFKEEAKIGERKEALLDLILKNTPSQHYEVGRSKKPLIIAMLPALYRVAAACLVLVLMATFLFSEFSIENSNEVIQQTAFITKRNLKGQKTSFFLPDKTKVVLNAESEISYPEHFGEGSREIFLEGEAYFDVTHDAKRKFLVRSGEIITEVHGTAFNVQAYPETPISIALQRGLVSVYPAFTEQPTIPQYLRPGEMITVKKEFDSSIKGQFDAEQMMGWIDGKLVFKQATMETLITKLERWYDVEIKVEGNTTDTWKVNGVFQNESLENVLEGVKYARGISYQINDHQVLITVK